MSSKIKQLTTHSKMTGTINSIIPKDQQRDIVCRLREEFKLKVKEAVLGKVTANTPKWKAIEKKFNKVGVRVVYFPYTKGISSTILNTMLVKEREELVKLDKRRKK